MWENAKWVTKRVVLVGGSAGVVVGGAGLATAQHVYAVPEANRKARPEFILGGNGVEGKTAVVIGGGVVGFTTARELARTGYKVRLLEKNAAAAEGTSKCPAGHISVSAYHSSFASISFVRAIGLGTFFTDPNWDHVDKPDDLAINKFVKFTTWLDWNFYAWGISWILLTLRSGTNLKVIRDARVRRVEDMKQALITAAAEESLTEIGGFSTAENGGRLNVAMHTFAQSGFGMRMADPNGHFERLSAKETADKEPLLAPAYEDGLIRGSLFAREDIYASCYHYVQGLALKLQQKYDVQVDYGVDVQNLVTRSTDKGPQMAGVQLKSGEVVTADVYVLAAGAETPDLAVSAGVHVPITGMRGYKICAPAKSGSTKPQQAICIKPYELYVTPLLDEVHFASYGEFAPKWDSKPTKDLERRLEDMVRLLFPNVDDIVHWDRRYHVWGTRPQTADGSPVVGPTRVANLYINAGHCSYGWRDSTLCAQLLTNGMRNGFEANGIHDRLHSLSRFQPMREAWPATSLDPTNMPSLHELGMDRRKK